jgi:hypothetical protein
MKILAIEREVDGVTGGVFTEPLKKAEAARVWELYQGDVIRELYFRQDQTSAVLVLECTSVEEAGRILDSLPLVKQGLIKFEIIPLAAYPGFARLFK